MATKSETATRRAGIYLRISEDRTGLEAGVKRQEQDCRDLAERLGWQIAGFYTDNGISAYNGKRRRLEYDRLKADLEAGRIDAVVAWHPDRLYRQAKELEAVIDLIAATQAVVATVQTGDIDLSTPNGRLVARIGASVAQHESEHKAARVKAWHRQRAQAGKPNGGRRPFGFRPDRVTHDAREAKVVREAARRILAGEQKTDIVRDFNRRGIRTVTGATWSSTMLRGLVTSPRIAGFREHNGVLHPAAWEGILDVDTWEAVKAAIQTGKAKPGRPATYLLSGILRCGLCGTKMTGNKTTRKVPVYRCPGINSHAQGCGRLGRSAARVEEHVAADVLAVLSGPGLRKAIRARSGATSKADDTVAVIGTLEGRLERLKSDFYVEDSMDKATFTRLKSELEAKLAAAYGRLDAAADGAALASIPTGDELAAWWETATIEQRRRAIGLVVDHVVIHPVGKGGTGAYNSAATEIIWKG